MFNMMFTAMLYDAFNGEDGGSTSTTVLVSFEKTSSENKVIAGRYLQFHLRF